MNIHTIYLHPAVLQAEAMLSREQPYPEDFTLAERTAERMTRARNGLAYVMTELAPRLDDEQAAIVYCWLDKVLAIVDIARIDAEASS
ncbi:MULTISPECIES: nicotinic acetylcholine receptor subunit beta [Klebsiella pneumoniae complex]|uniref:nicotinic acetylcholine receptor subunit beta n=1 Tax=Klebsiella pneumoniae complex TaxID=3390273 RepID=UPI001FB63361|nr:nicotinic acetylcholine receptor subunit beta [Klebsiella quasipneumoniae]MDX4796503.1 nicotinic acetylcholine receptor subunit beta [Klebsiella pneumoniae]HDT3641789.1 nicotinic acetylcholine receptor subunit beta [Klebsiella pneumoniae subsp. pneumoniae]MCJ1867912.1 nicotinic acetylcholine receptor subunit beta [Klebsiella quasipneumoniae subsp. similipneumoniae]MCU8814735.1 nicotinic acetylcholine receptor subunit beta [Klebsiella quasipneumoniae]HBW9472111.1 nicotinic acetylcholine rece